MAEQKHEFPITNTKIAGVNRIFDLTKKDEQTAYFEAKVGGELKKLQNYLTNSTFIAYLLGKKNAGKGTYSKMFAELVGTDKLNHFSVGDMVRGLDGVLQDETKKQELVTFLEKEYRGFIPLSEVIASLENRDTKSLLSTELILTLIKAEIAKHPKKAMFLDGFPRDFDQISYSLFFRDLVGYRDDPDFFVLINLPTSVIDERIKWRRICPQCQTSRNLKLFVTPDIEYDEHDKTFHLICDNPECSGIRMIPKEGDEEGTAPIADRLAKDEKLITQAFSLHGIPKILLRNTVPVDAAKENIEDYEITPEYVLEWNAAEKKVKVTEKPWIINDDDGIPSYSLLPHAVMISFIQQTVKVLGL